MRCRPRVSWSPRSPCRGWGPWGRFACSSWWCGNGTRWTGLSSCPGGPWWTRRGNRWSNGKLAWAQPGLNTCRHSTSTMGTTWSSMRTRCTRKVRRAWRGRPPTANIARCPSPPSSRSCKGFKSFFFRSQNCQQGWLTCVATTAGWSDIGCRSCSCPEPNLWRRTWRRDLIKMCFN